MAKSFRKGQKRLWKKREIVRNEQFLLFQQCFQKTSIADKNQPDMGHYFFSDILKPSSKSKAIFLNISMYHQVTDDIYMAIGYALANSIMIVGPDGVVIVDVTESYQAAKEIYAEFRKITDKPITDIIYTHNHGDHIGGALVG